MVIKTSDKDDFIKAVKSGKIVIYPTDTLYGIGCSITEMDKVIEIKKIKSRPNEQGLIIVAGSWSHVVHLVELSPKFHPLDQSWPNSTTYVFKAKIDAPKALTDWRAGGASVAIRIPQCALLKDLLVQTGPMISTSANFSGQKPARYSKSLDEDFLKLVDLVFENDDITSGVESKIIDFCSKKILR